MRSRGVVASAPTRIDLAGGTLDIWPISMWLPGAMTVNLAVDLRARVELHPGRRDRVLIESLDRKCRASRRLPLGASDVRGPLSLVLRLVRTFAPERGFRLVVSAAAPAGSGLGGSSALAVAVAGALRAWTGEALTRRALRERVTNVEAAELRVPTGNQDHLAAIHGGLAAYHHTVDGPTREALPIPRGLDERMVLAYTGEPRHSGFSNWAMFRRFVDGDARTTARFEAIAGLAVRMRAAILVGDLDGIGRLVGEEGRLRYGLAPTVATPRLRSVGAAALKAGALGVKVCGAGGGGCLLAVARRGRRDEVEAAMARAGATVLDAPLTRGGLRVEAAS